jgi:hypothetical protein
MFQKNKLECFPLRLISKTLAYLSGASAMKKKSYVTFTHTTSFFVIDVPEK